MVGLAVRLEPDPHQIRSRSSGVLQQAYFALRIRIHDPTLAERLQDALWECSGAKGEEQS